MIFLYCLWWLIINKTKPNLQGTLQGTLAFRGHLYSGDTCIQGTPLITEHLHSGDTSSQRTPAFRGLLWSGDTCIQGTPLVRGHLHSGDSSSQGTPAFRGHLYSGDSCIQGTPLFKGTPPFRGHLCLRDTCLGPESVPWIEVPLYFHIIFRRIDWDRFLQPITENNNAKINYQVTSPVKASPRRNV